MSPDEMLLDMEVGQESNSPPMAQPQIELPSQTNPEAGNQTSSNELANGGGTTTSTGTSTSTINNLGPGPGKVALNDWQGARGRGRGKEGVANSNCLYN